MRKRVQPTLAYGLIQSTMWGFYAILMSFSSNFLYGFGFEDHHISLLMGSACALSGGLQLLLGQWMSRWKRLGVYHALLAQGLFMGAFSLVMLYSPGKVLPVVGMGLGAIVLQAIPSFANAMGMDAIERGSGTVYSLARGMGSLAYSLLAMVTGQLVGRRGIGILPVVSLVTAGVFLCAVLWYYAAEPLARVPAGFSSSGSKGQAGSQRDFFRRYPAFTVFFFGCIFLYVSHNMLTNFMLQIMSVKGGGAGEQGTAAAISALVELPVIFGFPLLLKAMKCHKWVSLSAVFFVIKALGVWAARTPEGVYLAQCTQILGYALFSISAVYYAPALVGKGEAVRAQSFLGSTASIGSLMAMLLGGSLCKLLDPNAMVLFSAGFGLAGAVVIACSLAVYKKARCMP